jgi:tetratricopeptide (TPR) repeat protein
MGENPSLPFFRVKRWFAFAILATASVRLFGEVSQAPSAQTPANPPKQVSASVPAPTPERRALSLEPLPAESKADILMARGEYAAAIVAYQDANLKSANVWNSIGMAYHHMFALEQARKAYQTALAINPRFAAASNNLAAVYYGQHDYRDAEHFYKKALKHSSESAVIFCNLGTAYFAEAKYKQGMKAYRKAFEMDDKVFAPNQSAMIEAGSSREQRIAMNYFVAATYARVGKQEQALTYLRKAMDEGFKDRKRLDEDKDFATLRTTPEFQHLLDQENLN